MSTPEITADERLTLALLTIDRLKAELADARREVANKTTALKRAVEQRDNAMEAHMRTLTAQAAK